METIEFWKFLAGLAVFLYGMTLLESALRSLGGRSLKRFLREHTAHPLQAIISGIVVTALLQSSTVVSLMLLAFVGAGVITLRNALGVIIGANLGTTFTGWVVATLGFKFDIELFSLPLVAIGGLLALLASRKERLAEFGRFLFGFGLLFLGLEYMKLSVADLATSIDIGVFASYGWPAFFFIGWLLTAIIQSSSAAMVIILTALSAGIMPLESAAAMVIGSDLGTTMTVILGALKGTAEKRRVALSHFLFNLVTDLIALALLPWLLYLVQEVFAVEDPLLALVFFHSSFNLLGILLAYPFLGRFATFLESCFTGAPTSVARYLPTSSPDDVEIALNALENETRLLFDRAIALNKHVLDKHNSFIPLNDSSAELDRPKTYHEAYAQFKDLYGEIAIYNQRAHHQKMSESHSERFNTLMLAVYDIGSAAKGFKDIKHNLYVFEQALSDHVLQLKGMLCEKTLNFSKILESTKDAGESSTSAEEVARLWKGNDEIREDFLSNLNTAIRNGMLEDIEISSLQNVSREIYDSNRRLLRALEELWKCEQVAE